MGRGPAAGAAAAAGGAGMDPGAGTTSPSFSPSLARVLGSFQNLARGCGVGTDSDQRGGGVRQDVDPCACTCAALRHAGACRRSQASMRLHHHPADPQRLPTSRHPLHERAHAALLDLSKHLLELGVGLQLRHALLQRLVAHHGLHLRHLLLHLGALHGLLHGLLGRRVGEGWWGGGGCRGGS